LDHTQYLGDTLALIAQEKAGIIKANIPVVIGEEHRETKEVFEGIAKSNSAPICFADKRLKVNSAKRNEELQHFVIKNQQSGTSFEYELDLLGSYQRKNLLTTLTTLEILVPLLGIEKHHIVDGLRKVKHNTDLKGRWQVIEREPLIVCDAAHNKEGLGYVLDQLKEYSFNQLHIVLGFVNDKAIADLLALFPKDAMYYFSSPQIPRALALSDLLKEAATAQLKGEGYETVSLALEAAKKKAMKDDIIYVGGSTFVVAEVV
jgi:dihydrofolate synthase/folylpolyglutamate synthase